MKAAKRTSESKQRSEGKQKTGKKQKEKRRSGKNAPSERSAAGGRTDERAHARTGVRTNDDSERAHWRKEGNGSKQGRATKYKLPSPSHPPLTVCVGLLEVRFPQAADGRLQRVVRVGGAHQRLQADEHFGHRQRWRPVCVEGLLCFEDDCFWVLFVCVCVRVGCACVCARVSAPAGRRHTQCVKPDLQAAVMATPPAHYSASRLRDRDGAKIHSHAHTHARAHLHTCRSLAYALHGP